MAAVLRHHIAVLALELLYEWSKCYSATYAAVGADGGHIGCPTSAFLLR
jgi:hypothetical protein